ncbi:MAG: ankyrin repeat domain-containing protein [Verrucomicrobiae bacterium]|nr:ankyrin repeat domain-containing protein [Verrucomicrobiae bacterium]
MHRMSAKAFTVHCLYTLLTCCLAIVAAAQPESRLCTAIRYRQWAEALRMVKNGAADNQVEAQAALGMLASRWWGNKEDYALRWQLLKLLLARGADPFSIATGDAPADAQSSVVELSLRNVDPAFGDFLLTNRPDPALRTPSGQTSLHLAALSGRTDIIAFLLAAGFPVDQTNSDGLTPLQLIVFTGSKGTFVLTNDSPPFFMGYPHLKCSTPLPAAVAEFLLSRGAALDACSAAGMGMTNQLTSILRANPTAVNARDGLGRTPLHYAAKTCQPATAALLIKSGADCSARAKDGTTPLHLASAYENHEVVRILLDAGAPVDARDSEGNTPLHLCAQWGDPTTPRLLVGAGAPLDVVNRAGKTPLRIAVERGNDAVIELLMEAGARPDVGVIGETLLHVAASVGAPHPTMGLVGSHELTRQAGARSVQALLKRGLPVDARDSQGRTPLHRAVTALNWEAMNVLVSNGADINATDAYGNTPLHLVAQQKWEHVCLTIPAWVNRAEMEKKCELPLQVAVPFSTTNISLTAWLLAHGANPNLTNSQGRTPLELVCEQQWGYWEKESATNRVTLLFNAGTKVSRPGYDTLEECLAKIR